MSLNSAPARTDRIKVLVVDDSAVARGLIARSLEADPSIEVVGTAPNGEQALEAQRRRGADVVVLDIEMPVMDGLTALPRLLAETPGLVVIMASTLTRRNAEIGLRALQLGAADCVGKPEGGLGAAVEFHRELLAKVKGLAKPKPVAGQRPTTAPAPIRLAPRRSESPGRPGVLAIGSSTGGPAALVKVLEGLRGVGTPPILVTQHMPATFTAMLAEQLARAGDRPCAEARDGEPVVPGRCYVAPGGWHMVVEREPTGPVLRLNQEPPENFCRPAVDPMLRGVARVWGPTALAVVLTGMGSDGAKGCLAVADAGGRFIAQDEASSVVWGMPGAAAATGRAEQVLPLDEIGPWLRRVAGAPA